MVVEIFDKDTGKIWEYYLEPTLKLFLDKSIKESLEKKDKDYVMIIDGYEGAGKSTFAQQVGRYVDPTLHMDRVCMTAQEFKEAIIKARPNQCVIYDEAVTGMTAGDSISKIGKLLKSMMMQMRQKNLFVIIIIPTFFELNKYTVLSRARAFFHIYESNGNRGYWVGYNKKDMKKLYLLGKKTYSYKVKSIFKGRFYGKYALDEEEYRRKKQEALFIMEQEDSDTENHRWKQQRNAAIYLLCKECNFTYESLSNSLKRMGRFISISQIGDIVREIDGKTA